MKTVVCPIDFSTISLNAANYAADMACALNATLAIVYVCPVPSPISEVQVPGYLLEDLIAEAQVKGKAIKSDLAVRTKGKIRITFSVKPGEPVSGINEFCSTVSTFAVVMGAESTTALERFFFGGITISAVKHIMWPILVVPPNVEYSEIRKIGLACDFDKIIATIPVLEIISLVKEINAELHVINIKTDLDATYNSEVFSEAKWLRDKLIGLHPKYHLINGTNIEESLCKFAKLNEIDLLIVVPKKHHLLNKLFCESRSQRLVLQSHIPVMALHN
jgi:nucleotide-binding universal stress UspA family protein